MPDQVSLIHDIELPPDIGFWPIAWGWWLLLVILIASAISVVFYWRRNRYRFFAKKRLMSNFDSYQEHKNLHVYCQQAALLLRETAITHYGRANTANISGNEWITFLNSKVKSPIFNEQTAIYLTHAPFCDEAYFNAHFNNSDITQLHGCVVKWLRNHR